MLSGITMQQLLTIMVCTVIVLFVLIQWFLSMRPWFIWGLLMPLMFGLFWFCVVKKPSFLPLDLGLNEVAVSLYIAISRMGLLFSLLIFIFCRLLLWLRKKNKAKKRNARVAEKNRLRSEHAAISGSCPAPERRAAGPAARGGACGRNAAAPTPAQPPAEPTQDVEPEK